MSEPSLPDSGRPPDRPGGYVADVPKSEETQQGPTALMKKVLQQLRDLKALRGLTFEVIEKRGGRGQQVWDKWEKGASPQIESLEVTALALDAELLVDVRDKRLPSMRPVAAGISQESIEIVAAVDSIPDERIRRRIADVVHRMAAMSAYGAAPAPGKPIRRKK